MTAVDSVATSAGVALELSLLRGEWVNTNAKGGIERISISERVDGTLMVRSIGRMGEGTTADWGAVEGHASAFRFDERMAGAFDAVYDLRFLEVRMQANVKAGVLVVATFNAFRDATGRSSYFDREFFHRVSP